MKILLIGKYPPMQGGISAKTYWLFKELVKHGFDLNALTVEPKDYSIKGDIFDNTKSKSIKINEPPWHIPETELLSDRIFQSAMEMVADFKPDLIEINYLWPFSLPAILVAKIVGKPLIIRHAGSDIQKFYQDAEYKNNIKTYFQQASSIVTNHNSEAFINELCDDPVKVKCLRRYVPNPDFFQAVPSEKQYDILFTGKINYHWNLKGIHILLDYIKDRRLKSLFVIGGKYKQQVIELIAHKKINDQIEIKDFVHPEEMPAIYNLCKSVWCWDEKGSLEDFSNIIWEALYCGIPCIVNAEKVERIKNEGIPDGFMPFIKKITPSQLKDINLFADNLAEIDVNELESEKRTSYLDYVNSNLELYNTLCN